jgi:hypothetical protein
MPTTGTPTMIKLAPIPVSYRGLQVIITGTLQTKEASPPDQTNDTAPGTCH